MADGTMAFCNKRDNETGDQNGLQTTTKSGYEKKGTPISSSTDIIPPFRFSISSHNF
jgi:hypothetical protein